MPIQLKDLKRPTPGEETQVYLVEEFELYQSFARNLRAAKVLTKANEHDSALYSLFIATESLLKVAVCVIRHKNGFNAQTSAILKRLMAIPKSSRDREIEKIFGSRVFSHDLKALALFIKSEVSEISASPNHIDALIAALDEGEWVSLRYSEKVTSNSFGQYKKLYAALVQLANSEFRNLVKGGDI